MRHVLLVVVASMLATVAAATQDRTPRPQPPTALELFVAADAVVVGTCESSATSDVTRDGSNAATRPVHVVRVDRFEAGGSPRAAGVAPLKPGDRIAVRSHLESGDADQAAPPLSPSRRGRAYLTDDGTTDGAGRRMFTLASANGWRPQARDVTFVGADDEYRSEVTMPLVAGICAREGGMTTTVAFPADPATGALDVERRDHIANVSTLQAADVAVFYMRWREFDDESWKAVSTFLRSGKPIVGLRTTTHFLRTKDGTLDNDVPARVFGQRWISHHGHESKTRVLRPEGAAAEHPILRGVRGEFVVPSWLYDVEPLPKDCRVLLYGEVVGRDGDSTKQPIVWIREAGPDTPTPFPDGGTPARRMAFTTLGHPGDFENAEVRRLVAQMILWAAGDEASIPKDGLPATLSAPYAAPPTR
ncbi:MAG: ThuA domain-containing protein [Phycisphaerae bacterium]|nr:ThuA domain-containing protein [Phycisphaerae bacterium]